jgi:hypothetical protein
MHYAIYDLSFLSSKHLVDTHSMPSGGQYWTSRARQGYPGHVIDALFVIRIVPDSIILRFLRLAHCIQDILQPECRQDGFLNMLIQQN